MDQELANTNDGPVSIFEQVLALTCTNRAKTENNSFIPKASTITPNMKTFLPCYTKILIRSPEESVDAKDLNQLQTDLEYLLTTVVLQRKALSFKRNLLKDDKKHPKLKKTKHRFIAKKNYKNKKRLKQTPAVKKTLRVNDTFRKLDAPRAAVLKNDTSDRYWLAIEPLCGDITKDATVFLDNMIRECSENTEVTIPDVSEHFTSKWAETRLSYEKSLSCAQKTLERTTIPDLYKNEKAMQKNCITSSLKRRLLKAFREEQSSTANKSPLNNSSRFHKTLRKEFIKKRLLKNRTVDAEHEVLFEIKKSILQLKLVNDHNLTELNNLKEVVVKELKKQEVKQSLDKLDEEMMAIYNKIVSSKEKSGLYTNLSSCPRISAEDEAKAKRILEQQSNLQDKLIDYTVAVIS